MLVLIVWIIGALTCSLMVARDANKPRTELTVPVAH